MRIDNCLLVFVDLPAYVFNDGWAFVDEARPHLYQRSARVYFFHRVGAGKDTAAGDDGNTSLCFLMNVLYNFGTSCLYRQTA